MPLEKSSSEASLHENIKRLIAEGKPRKQAVAIAYQIQEKGDDTLECDPLGYEKMSYLQTNQSGAANPLGFVYGGIANQNKMVQNAQTFNQYPLG